MDIKHAICNNYQITMSRYIVPNKLCYIKLDPELEQRGYDLPSIKHALTETGVKFI